MPIFRKQGLSFRHQRRQVKLVAVRRILFIVIEAAAALALAFVLVYGWGLRVTVVGTSMDGTLTEGETVLVNRVVYRFSNPKSGDVVVFLPNGNDKNPYYVMRVVAAPGDTVQIKDGVIYVDGFMFDEYDTEAVNYAGLAESELTMGEDEYFVIGDNRNGSEDSRYASFGYLSKEYIIGKAWFRYNAINDLGRVR